MEFQRGSVWNIEYLGILLPFIVTLMWPFWRVVFVPWIHIWILVVNFLYVTTVWYVSYTCNMRPLQIYWILPHFLRWIRISPAATRVVSYLFLCSLVEKHKVGNIDPDMSVSFCLKTSGILQENKSMRSCQGNTLIPMWVSFPAGSSTKPASSQRSFSVFKNVRHWYPRHSIGISCLFKEHRILFVSNWS